MTPFKIPSNPPCTDLPLKITYMISIEDNERAGCDTVTSDFCAFNMPGSMDDAVTRTVAVEVSPCNADITMEVIRDGGATARLAAKDSLSHDDDPGWYENPEGTLALPATEDELRRDLA